MNPIVRQFFRGLRERDELDAIIPELLTAAGYEVLSRPMVGTRQYGVDVAAVGIDVDGDGARKLFLFSIKRGDLTRQEWDGDADQALRPSLNEIRDVYLAGIAPEHRGLPVVVVITIGGIVRENVVPMLNGYMASENRPGLEFRLWTGDTLTIRLLEGALREEVFPDAMRTMLRRAAALVIEPDNALGHFGALIDAVLADENAEQIKRVGILYVSLWIFFVWGRDAGNLEAPYRASELVVLRAWALLNDQIEHDEGRTLSASHTFYELVQLHLRIWDELYKTKILPHADSEYALSYAVCSYESIDINLALFETVGRVAMGGLWRLWSVNDVRTTPQLIGRTQGDPTETAIGLARLIRSNPALLTPATEQQGVDIVLGLMLLAAVPATRNAAAQWAQQMSRATRLCYQRGQGYPITSGDYETLINQPVSPSPAEKREATAAGTIQPILAAFAWGLGRPNIATEIAEFQQSDLSHCNLQLWVPNERSEPKLWRAERLNGSSLGSLKIGDNGDALVTVLRREVEQNKAFDALSAIRLDHWPMLLLACRVARLPPPPQLWLPLIDIFAAEPMLDEISPDFAIDRRVHGGRVAALRAAISTSSSTPLGWPTYTAATPFDLS